jgi:hypothetical protein
MKKSTLFFVVLLMGITAFQPEKLKAQITALATDFPKIGGVYVVANDSTTQSYSPSPMGANVVWNYDTLSITTIDTLKGINPAGPDTVFYPNASLELTYSIGALKSAFLTNTFNELELWGVLELVNAHQYPVVYRPSSQELYEYPLAYKDSWKGGYAYRIQGPDSAIGYDSLRINYYADYKDTVDSWGKCTTPFGTKNVLRHRQTELTLDSAFRQSDTVPHPWRYINHSSTVTRDTTYTWIADSLGYPMLTMTKNGTVKVASWLKKTNIYDGINAVTDKAGSLVYPNPASTQLNIRLASCETGYVVIMDITGRQISTTEFNSKYANINTATLSNGMYFYRITDKMGNYIDAGKFTVMK